MDVRNYLPDSCETLRFGAMTRTPLHLVGLMVYVVCLSITNANDHQGEKEAVRIGELNEYWAKVSKAVKKGDFASYQSTCHREAVLVSGTSKTSYPLAKALARWKSEFDATKAGNMKASVAFRFSQRLGDATTAHETGIFRYSQTKPGAEPTVEYIHFVALLVKKADGWKILMENQASSASQAEWDKLAK